MDDDARRTLLDAVARGEITPDEAAARLRDDPPAGEHRTDGPSEHAQHDRETDDVSLIILAGAVKIVGDPTVATIDVDGDHELDRDGRTLIVRCTAPGDGMPFALLGGRRRGRRRGRHDFVGPTRATIRINPDLPLDVDGDASAIDIRGVHAPIRARLNAGTLSLHDVTDPFDVAIRAGVVRVAGRLDDGDSSITCDMGRVRVDLDPTSNVSVDSSVDLGHVAVRLDRTPAGPGRFTLGNGRGSLRIDGNMSSIDIHADGRTSTTTAAHW